MRRHLDPRHALLLAAAATLLVYFVPWLRPLAWPLLLISTVVHELGHGLAAFALGGDFGRLLIWNDGSGVAAYQGAFSGAGRAFVAAAGPLAPPIAAAGLFAACRSPNAARNGLRIVAVALLAIDLLWVRNAFGFAFVAGLSVLLAAVAWRAPPRATQFTCAFLGLQLCLAAFARADYLFSSAARTASGSMPSDTAQIASELFLPYWFWGGLLALVSLAVLGLGLRGFLRA